MARRGARPPCRRTGEPGSRPGPTQAYVALKEALWYSASAQLDEVLRLEGAAAGASRLARTTTRAPCRPSSRNAGPTSPEPDAESGPHAGTPELRARRAAGSPVKASAAPQYDVGRLLAVAVEVFIERGYDGTSMEDLARATGISKSSIYHHVESKEQLLRLALDRALDALFAITEEGAQTARAIDRLQYVIGRVVEVLCAELPYVTVLLRVRGNTETERWALERRRAVRPFRPLPS